MYIRRVQAYCAFSIYIIGIAHLVQLLNCSYSNTLRNFLNDIDPKSQFIYKSIEVELLHLISKVISMYCAV